jgi:hypothetical protein
MVHLEVKKSFNSTVSRFHSTTKPPVVPLASTVTCCACFQHFLRVEEASSLAHFVSCRRNMSG